MLLPDPPRRIPVREKRRETRTVKSRDVSARGFRTRVNSTSEFAATFCVRDKIPKRKIVAVGNLPVHAPRKEPLVYLFILTGSRTLRSMKSFLISACGKQTVFRDLLHEDLREDSCQLN